MSVLTAIIHCEAAAAPQIDPATGAPYSFRDLARHANSRLIKLSTTLVDENLDIIDEQTDLINSAVPVYNEAGHQITAQRLAAEGVSLAAAINNTLALVRQSDRIVVHNAAVAVPVIFAELWRAVAAVSSGGAAPVPAQTLARSAQTLLAEISRRRIVCTMKIGQDLAKKSMSLGDLTAWARSRLQPPVPGPAPTLRCDASHVREVLQILGRTKLKPLADAFSTPAYRLVLDPLPMPAKTDAGNTHGGYNVLRPMNQ